MIVDNDGGGYDGDDHAGDDDIIMKANLQARAG